eukprot:9972187-Heterocapsa_arctica.AAC.1
MLGWCCRRRRRTAATTSRWIRLLRHLARLRRLQRLFAYAGQHLDQAYPRSLRQRLRLVYPTGRQVALLG